MIKIAINKLVPLKPEEVRRKFELKYKLENQIK